MSELVCSDSEERLDDMSRQFLTVSSKMANAFSWGYEMVTGRLIAPISPGKFENASNVITEVGVRALIVLGAALSFIFVGTHLNCFCAEYRGDDLAGCRIVSSKKWGDSHSRKPASKKNR
jgi:hypothetical protein